MYASASPIPSMYETNINVCLCENYGQEQQGSDNIVTVGDLENQLGRL